MNSSLHFYPFLPCVFFVGTDTLRTVLSHRVDISVVNMATLAFFWLLFNMMYLSLFTFNLYVSLYLNWVSYRQQTTGACFLVYSHSHFLLIGEFRPIDVQSDFYHSWINVYYSDILFSIYFPCSLLFLFLFSTLFLPLVVLIDHFI